MSEGLKPCPFCGHDEIEVERPGTPRQSCIVACQWCGCRLESNEEGAGEAWNRRTPGVARLPVGLRVEQISEGDAEKLFGAAGSTPDVVGRIRESRRMAARTPDVSRLLEAAKRARGVIGHTWETSFKCLKDDLDAAIAEFEAATK